MSHTPRVEIEFCYQCNWTARAAWMAQEVLASLEDSVGEVALVPSTGGVFDIRVDGHTVWSREEKDRFPQPKELKQVVRDAVAPETDLGHADAD
jgi:selenoprotein W-related protein